MPPGRGGTARRPLRRSGRTGPPRRRRDARRRGRRAASSCRCRDRRARTARPTPGAASRDRAESSAGPTYGVEALRTSGTGRGRHTVSTAVRLAMEASSRRSPTWNFRSSDETWVSTVRSETKRRSAISALVSRWLKRARTSRSRRVIFGSSAVPATLTSTSIAGSDLRGQYGCHKRTDHGHLGRSSRARPSQAPGEISEMQHDFTGELVIPTPCPRALGVRADA